MLNYRWNISPEANKNTVDELAKSLNINTTLSNILVQRGIDSYESARDFFVPRLSALHNPLLMKDMDKAVARIITAIGNGENILIYGDYDVDGTTSVAMLYSFLKSFYPNLDYYIPDRYTEGYGISEQGVRFAAEHNFSLVIALDCGVKANDKIDLANSLGVDFIICDHHLPGNELPKAIAVLDPKRQDCNYPYKELSGCGVGFKLMQALCQDQGWDEQLAFEYLDLLAISIAADIVPITGENRILTHFGLTKLNQGQSRPGLTLLINNATKQKTMSITDVVFIIAPRINAAGRITSGRNAVALLIAQNEREAEPLAKGINQNNSDRKDLDKIITQEALAYIAADSELQNAKSTVVFQHDWHKGVVGIVASRLIENHYRPTIVLTESNGKATGSARSVAGFDVHEAIGNCADLLEQYGGHMYAAGLTLKLENIPAFKAKFEQVVSEKISPEQLIPAISIDAKLDFSQISSNFFKVLKRMQPFGPGNMNPVFYTEHVVDSGYAKIVGENHLKCEFYQIGEDRLKFSAIGFKLAHLLPLLQSKKPLKIAYTIEENFFREEVKLQLIVKDIKYT